MTAFAGWLELLANAVLFLSSLLLLVDYLAPRGVLPSHRRRVAAVRTLRETKMIFGDLPPETSVQPQPPGMVLVKDAATFSVLVQFIRERSHRASSLDWNRVVGVGYHVISVPVGNSSLDALRPVYVMLIPQGTASELELQPVGHLDQLSEWLCTDRQGFLTRCAIWLLCAGFLLQLYLAVCF